MMKSDTFRDRYLIASFPTGAVVVDLETGNYFYVDPVAAQVCYVLANGDPAAAATEVAKRLKVSESQATRAVSDTRSALATAPVRGTPPGPYHFYPEEQGFGLWHAGRRVLAVAGEDLDIFVPPGGDVERSPLLEFYVRALAPKLMFLRGLTVLHASACATSSGVVAFAGPSGAGKTTTAQAFARVGARLIVEDLVVLKPRTPRPSLVLDGEARVHAWAREISASLAGGVGRVSSSEIATLANGPHESIDALFFVDVARRRGSHFGARSLKGPEGLLAVMTNDFLGASSRDGWRRYFEAAASIASTTELVEMTAPLGIENLEAAAKRYMSNWTSYGLAGPAGSPSQA